MDSGCYHLGKMTAATIRLYCPQYHRFAQSLLQVLTPKVRGDE